MRKLSTEQARAMAERSAEARRRPNDWTEELQRQVNRDAPGFVRRLISTGAGAVKASELLIQAERSKEARAYAEATARTHLDAPTPAPIGAVVALIAESGQLSDDHLSQILCAVPRDQLERCLIAAGHKVER
jgi:hypothetical protein